MTYNAYSLDGKLVLVTGGGTGIGRGVALELARQGADVALSYASSAKGALGAVEEIQGMGRRAIAIKGNLSEAGGGRSSSFPGWFGWAGEQCRNYCDG